MIMIIYLFCFHQTRLSIVIEVPSPAGEVFPLQPSNLFF